MIKNKMLIIRLNILYLKFKSLKVDIKFAIKKVYYRIFDSKKYQNLLQTQKDMQEILDAIDDRMNWV